MKKYKIIPAVGIILLLLIGMMAVCVAAEDTKTPVAPVAPPTKVTPPATNTPPAVTNVVTLTNVVYKVEQPAKPVKKVSVWAKIKDIVLGNNVKVVVVFHNNK